MTLFPLNLVPLFTPWRRNLRLYVRLFYFVMTLLMLDEEQARLMTTEKINGETIWSLQTMRGESFRIIRPTFGHRQEQALMEENSIVSTCPSIEPFVSLILSDQIRVPASPHSSQSS